MYLVDEKYNVAQPLDFLDKPFHAALELSAELRARYQRSHVEQVNGLVVQTVGHVARTDALSYALGYRGLADAGLAYQAWVVFLTAREYLNNAF